MSRPRYRGSMSYTFTPPRLLTVGQTARRHHVTVKWLRAEAEAGRVPCLNADGRLLFDPECVERVLLERARHGGQPNAT